VGDGNEAVAPAVLVTGVGINARWGGRVRLGSGAVGGVGDISKLGVARRLTASETDAFNVGFVEVNLEVGNGVVGSWELAPIAKVMMEDA
jgi:hypothetical protein